MEEDLNDYLAQDVDEFSGRFSGTLSFEEEAKGGMIRDASAQSLGLTFADVGSSKPFKQGPGNVSFEVVNARIAKDGRDKFVTYSILIVGTPGYDTCPMTVEKRFSDLHQLDVILRKKFPDILKNISFPKKVLTGNYKPETIAQRSRAFEQYLSHLFTVDVIRLSSDFGQLFFGTDLQDGYECINNGKYEQAVPLLQRVANIEQKILGCDSKNVIATLCALVCCYQAVDKDKQAQSVAEAALRCVGKDEHNKHLIPLLQLSIRLCWKLGKDKRDLEGQLQGLRDKGLQVQGGSSLLELVVRRFQRR